MTEPEKMAKTKPLTWRSRDAACGLLVIGLCLLVGVASCVLALLLGPR